MPWEIAERNAHRIKALAHLEGREEEANLTAEEIIEREAHRARALAFLEGRETDLEYPTFSYSYLPGLFRVMEGDAQDHVQLNPTQVPSPPFDLEDAVKRDEEIKDLNAGWAAKMAWEGKESKEPQVTVEETKQSQDYARDSKPLPPKPTFLAMMKRKISGGNWERLGKLKPRGSQ